MQNDLFRSIPVELMLRYVFVPEEQLPGRLSIVMADPTDVRKIDELEMLLGQPVEVKVGAASAIEEILEKSESAQSVLDQATEGFRIELLPEDEESSDVITLDTITQDQSPIIKLVDSTLFNAIQRRASDIHIETGENEVLIKYRIDGALYQAMDAIDRRHHSTIISRIKVMSELDISEKRVPQDGRFKLHLRGRTIDFRVSILPTVHGEDCVIRILDKESMNEEFKNLSLDILGIDEITKRKLRKFIREPYGMVLVTGPTGSGKTTTLYACLSEIQSVEDKIITIEDPVEYQLRGVTQIPVNEKKGLTFARGLRAILRHDPDKVMIGEIRDEETAQIAIQSALTGHLVFTTVHANNVIDVLGRFLNMNVDLYNFVSALNCVLAQRLVRKICPHCRRPARITRTLLGGKAVSTPRPTPTTRSTRVPAASSATEPDTTADSRYPSSSTSPIRSASLFSPSVPPPRSAAWRRKKAWRSSANPLWKKPSRESPLSVRSTKLPSWIEGILGLAPMAPPPHAFALDEHGIRYARFVPEVGGLGPRRNPQCRVAGGGLRTGPTRWSYARRDGLPRRPQRAGSGARSAAGGRFSRPTRSVDATDLHRERRAPQERLSTRRSAAIQAATTRSLSGRGSQGIGHPRDAHCPGKKNPTACSSVLGWRC